MTKGVIKFGTEQHNGESGEPGRNPSLAEKILSRREGKWNESDGRVVPDGEGSGQSWVRGITIATLLEIRDILNQNEDGLAEAEIERHIFAQLLRQSHCLDLYGAQLGRQYHSGNPDITDGLNELVSQEVMMAERLLDLIKKLPQTGHARLPTDSGRFMTAKTNGVFQLHEDFSDRATGLDLPKGTAIGKPLFVFACRTYEKLCSGKELLCPRGKKLRQGFERLVISTIRGAIEEKLQRHSDAPSSSILELNDEMDVVKFLADFCGASSMLDLLVQMNRTLYKRRRAAVLMGSNTSAEENDTPKYGWDDTNQYLRQAESATGDAERLRARKRASVAKIMRLLLNRDLAEGETGKIEGIHLNLDRGPSISSLPNAFFVNPDDRMSEQPLTLADSYAPLKFILDCHRNRFLDMLRKRYEGRQFYIYGRTKAIGSLLLKQLKEKQTVSAGIVDLIGCTVLTDSREEAEKVIEDIRSLMDKDRYIKEIRCWPTPKPLTGRESLDLTGYLQGAEVMIQVQCRTKEIDERENGKLANHYAYKVLSGMDLLEQIDADPDGYLDLLYKAIHNLHMAGRQCTPHPNPNRTGVILSRYSREYDEIGLTKIGG